MSWFQKAKLAAKIVADSTSEAFQELSQEVEDEFGKEEWYQDVKKSAQDLERSSVRIFQESKDLGASLAEDLGDTEFGKSLGEQTKSVAKYLSTLPVLSLASDVMKTRHGVPELYEIFSQDPTNPTKAIWLAEALDRVQLDMKIYSRLRSFTSPTYALVSQSIKMASQLGSTPTDPTQIRLLKLSFSQSISRIQKNPRDSVALHALARVYLSQKFAAEAIQFSKLAIVADTTTALPWLTLSRGYLGLEQFENATKAAKRAIDASETYGYELLAKIAMCSSDEYNSFSDIENHESLIQKVTQESRRAYLGVNLEGVKILEGIGKEQLQKLDNIFS